MCKKDTSGGGGKCCTRTVISGVVMLVGAAIMVASFVVAAVVLTMLQDGVNNTARYNSPDTDATAYNDFLSNIPEKRSTNDASLRYYAYYLFNITNLDEMVTAHVTTATKIVPAVSEIGPYVYRKFHDKFNVAFDTAQDKVTWQEYGRYYFQPELSKMGSQQLSDSGDIFTQASSLYSALFANPLGGATYGQPEWGFRMAAGGVVPIVYTRFLNTAFQTAQGFALLNQTGLPTIDAAASVHYLAGSRFTNLIPYTKASQIFPLINPAWTGAPPLEMWNYFEQHGLDAFKISANQALGLVSAVTNTATPSPVAFPTIPCADMTLSRASGSVLFCYLFNDDVTVATGLASLGLTVGQVGAIKAWLNHTLHDQFNWLFKSMGHQADHFQNLFTSSCQPGPDYAFSSRVGDPGCFTFNTGNMWIRASAKSLLFENLHLLGPLISTLKGGSAHPTRISYFSNSTSQSDAAVDNEINQVGTGINHIGDVDNIYKFKGTGVLPTAGNGAVWCHQLSDPNYAPASLYYIQSFQKSGQTFQQVSQAEATKYSPNYPPGRVDDSNRYSLKASVMDDRSFVVDVWVSDITRHAKMVWYSDISLKGIDLRRYTISDAEFIKIPFFGQYYDGLANYTCPSAGGPTLFACLPRYQKINQSDCNVRGGFEFAAITAPANADFNRDAPFGGNFFLAEELLPFIDFEPVSGAALAGTLKMQLNLMVTSFTGAPRLQWVAVNGNPAVWRTTGPRAPTIIPSLWLSKIGFLSDKQADKFKSTIYAAQLASKVVLIVGTIVGGVLMFAGLAFFIVNIRKGGAYGSQTSKSDLAL